MGGGLTQRSLADKGIELTMGYTIPETVTTKGPFQPMRFEATVEECIVTHGEIPQDLAGGFYR
ncbi:MAG: hypothetical protein EPN51_27615, partial [Mycobacterium sp.]